MKFLPLAASIAALLATTSHAAVTELELYKDSQFRGPAQTIKGEVANLENGMRREVSSVAARGDRWGRRGGLILYGQEGFAGRSLEIGEDVPDLSQRRFGDRASSLVVERGLWQLCTEPNYRGRCRTFRRGDYRELRGFDDRISSVRRVE